MTATLIPFPPAEPTEPIDFPWTKPPITATYRTPRARARHIAYRLARSPFVQDVRAAVSAAFYPLMIGSGVLIAVTILFATRGQYVGWDGLHAIPTAGAR